MLENNHNHRAKVRSIPKQMPTQNNQDLLTEHYIQRGPEKSNWHQLGHVLRMSANSILREEETEVVQRRHGDVQ